MNESNEYSDLIEHLENYEHVFDDIFPSFAFKSTEDQEIIKIIKECIKKNKDVYDLGYLSLDNIY